MIPEHEQNITCNDSNILYKDCFKTAFGFLGVLFDSDLKLVYIVLPTDEESVQRELEQKAPSDKFTIQQKEYFGRNRFIEYFKGNEDSYSDSSVSNLPINLDYFEMSEFQKQVLSSCSLVPYGTTITYENLGTLIGNTSYQAIGMALSKNPLPIIIPCHRIVGKKGIGGFTANEGISLKKRLLELEAPKTI